MNLPTTRVLALAVGSKRYFTGRPCPHGHLAPRFTSSFGCIECASIAAHQWREENRDRISEYNSQKYWSDAEFHRERAKKYRLMNPELSKASEKRWRLVNIDKCRKYGRLRNIRFPEKNRARVRQWRKENPEKAKELLRNCRARRRGADGNHTNLDVNNIRKMQKDRCAVCGVNLDNKGHVDHIQPLKRGGSNWPRNLQILCADCNHQKNSRDPIEFMQSRGLLL